MAKSIAFTKIGRHRGGDRLWLEGRKIERAGILPGQKFDVEWLPEEGRVVLTFGETGSRTVSRRVRNNREMPIVSVAASELGDIFGPGLERAKVSIQPGRMVVEVHPLDVACRERIERLTRNVAEGATMATGSLAHGGGILDHAIHVGLASQGISSTLAFAVEIDPAILDVAASNNDAWSDGTLLVEGGMEEVDPDDLPKVDLLVAGLPCVGASVAGKAKNAIKAAEEHPTAGALFVSFLQIVKKTNPSIIVLENVVGYGREISAMVIRTKLREWGYDIYETVLKGNEFGTLDNRHRLCLIAATKDLALDMEMLVPVRMKEATVGEVLEYVDPDSDAWKDVSYLVDKEARDREAGKNFSMNFVDPADEQIRTLGAGYWKWRSTEPLIPHGDKPKFARLLTPEEHARVKGIPSHLVDNISKTLAHTIMGNSVIYPAFEAVGAFLAGQISTHVHGPVIDMPSAEEMIPLMEHPVEISAVVATLRQMAFDFEDAVSEPEPVRPPAPRM